MGVGEALAEESHFGRQTVTAMPTFIEIKKKTQKGSLKFLLNNYMCKVVFKIVLHQYTRLNRRITGTLERYLGLHYTAA